MKNFVKIQPQLYNFINIILDISSITDRILLLEILTINSIFGSIISVKKKYFGDKILVNILGQAQIHYLFFNQVMLTFCGRLLNFIFLEAKAHGRML